MVNPEFRQLSSSTPRFHRWGSNMQNLGKAWIILEESFHSNKKRLVAILSPRKTIAFVADYIEQAYVDQFASFDEKITFKKGKLESNFNITRHTAGGTTIRHGHDPMFNAYYAHKLERKGEILIFHYRVYKGNSDNREFSEHVKNITIDGYAHQ